MAWLVLGCAPDPQQIYREALPGVVAVVSVHQLPPEQSVGAESAPTEPRRISASMGSGLLLDAAGLVATAAHVLAGEDRVGVVFDGGARVRATVLGRDPLTDLALLRAERVPPGARPLRFAADPAEVGQPVFALGNPDGLPASFTAGVVSGLHRRGVEDRVYHDFVQTDCALFPGNSGGPLLDGRGRVLGLVVGVDRDRRGAGFALPVARAASVLDRLGRPGGWRRGFLGASAVDPPDELNALLSVPPRQGALLRKVVDASPAAAAGLQAGDFVLRAAGRTLHGRRDLAWAAALCEPGQTLGLTLLRGGAEVALRVPCAVRPEPLPPGGTHAF